MYPPRGHIFTIRRRAGCPHPAGKAEPLRQPPCRLGKLEFVEILIGHIVVLDLPGGFHDSFRQRANIHNRGVLLVLGADKKCGDATRIIIIGNLRFRIRQDQCKLFIRINFFVFLIVFNVFSDSID